MPVSMSITFRRTMSRILKITFTMLAFLLVVNQTSHAQGSTLMDLIASDLRLDEFRAAINTAELSDMLRGPGPYTILAPVDGAFIASRNSGDMRGLVLYHGLKDTYTNDDLKGRSEVTTLLGAELQLENNRGVTINGQAKMVAINIKASNGILHIIHLPLTPPEGAEVPTLESLNEPDEPDAADGEAEASPTGTPSLAAEDPGPTTFNNPNRNSAYVSGGLMPYWMGIATDATVCKGMTWVMVEGWAGYSKVGADRRTNPYRGDTSCDQSLPMLCFNRDMSGAPALSFRDSWSYGAVRPTVPVQGYELSSQATADAYCEASYGEGWRMAEYHDAAFGRQIGPVSGHDFWARGNAPFGRRFWVSIHDQPANPWNSVLPPNGANGLGAVSSGNGGGRVELPGDDPAFVGAGPARMTRNQGLAAGKMACSGMTWVIYRQMGGLVQVGTDSMTNPFVGDQSCNATYPLLCIRVDGFAVPPSTNGQNYATGWSAGAVKLTRPVNGNEISTRAAASDLCVGSFGNGWRMAEFHDGSLGSQGSGWSLWAYGNLPTGQRFWVANNDQMANPWNR